MKHSIYDNLYKQFPPEQAEAIILAIETEFATKSDLTAVEERLERKIIESKMELNNNINSVKDELNKIDIKMENFSTNFSSMEKNIANSLKISILKWMGGMVVATAAVVGAIVKFL